MTNLRTPMTVSLSEHIRLVWRGMSISQRWIHLSVWLTGWILVNIPSFELTIGYFYSKDLSLIIPSAYGSILNASLFYGTIWLIQELYFKNLQRFLKKALHLFSFILLLECLLDFVCFSIYHGQLDVLTAFDIIFGNILINAFLFFLPALLVGLLRGSHNEEETPAKVLIQDGHQQVYLPHHEVYFLESSGNYVTYHTSEKKYVVRKSLSQAEKDLPNSFLRCHKSYIVNSQLIRKKSYGEIMVADRRIPVGRKYQEKLKAKLLSTS